MHPFFLFFFLSFQCLKIYLHLEICNNLFNFPAETEKAIRIASIHQAQFQDK